MKTTLRGDVTAGKKNWKVQCIDVIQCILEAI